jgi:hypothetical protein
MATHGNLLLHLRLQAALESLDSAPEQADADARRALALLGQLAEHTRTQADASLEVPSAALEAVPVTPVTRRLLVGVASDAGLLTADPTAGTLAFTGAFERDALAAGFLMQFLESEHSDRGVVRDRVTTTLSRIGLAAIPALLQGLGHPDSMVRRGAAVALRDMGSLAVPALAAAVGTGNRKVRRHAIQALQEAAPARRAEEMLIDRLLNDEDDLVRAEAALALGEAASAAATDALVQALGDTRPSVRDIVRMTLKALDTPTARRALDRERGERPPDDDRDATKSWAGSASRLSPQRPRVFLSYPREHQATVERLRKLLSDAGFDPWLDLKHLQAGDRWEAALDAALRGSDFVVACLARETHDGYQKRELERAIEYRPAGRDPALPFVLPCALDDETWEGRPASMPEPLRALHLIDLRRPELEAPRVREALTRAALGAGFVVPTYLRTEPAGDLRPAQAHGMLLQQNFYDGNINDRGEPPYFRFGGLEALADGRLVRDRATHRLWTRDCLPVESAAGDAAPALAVDAVRQRANREAYGGHRDWRLPTLEEAMSLMLPHVRSGGLHIDALFSDEAYVWTADSFLVTAEPVLRMNWYACYGPGDCQPAPGNAHAGVRLVRLE